MRPDLHPAVFGRPNKAGHTGVIPPMPAAGNICRAYRAENRSFRRNARGLFRLANISI
jgi:hypothetical protein